MCLYVSIHVVDPQLCGCACMFFVCMYVGVCMDRYGWMGVCVCLYVWVDRCGVDACMCLSVYICGCVYGWMWMDGCVCGSACAGGYTWVWMCAHVCMCVGVCGCVCTLVSSVLPFHVNMTKVHICFHSLKEQRMLASLWGELCLASVQTPPTVPLFSLLWNLSKWAGLSHPTALPHESSLCEESGFLRSTIKVTGFLISCVYRHLTCLFLTLKGSIFISTHYICFLFICLQSAYLLQS